MQNEDHALREALLLIDEINERSTSRKFYGISQTLHAKLATIRATLARAALSATPPQEASSGCMLSGCMDFSESSTPTHAPIGNEALVEEVRQTVYDSDDWGNRDDADRIARAVLALPSIATVEQSSKVQSALLEEAIGALEDVVNPLGHLQREADADGARLSGMAYSITNDLSFVQQIARATLAKLKEGRA